MSLSDTLKDKKKVVILVVIVIALVIVLAITFIPFGGEKPATGPQVISQKAKITLPDETAKPTATTATPAKPAATAKTDAKATSPEAAKAVEKPQKAPQVKAQVQAKIPVPEPKPTQAAKSEVKPSKTVKAAKYTGKSWVVNAASFTTKDEAKGFAKALKLAGYKSYVTEFTKDDTEWYRVRAGFFSTQSDAQKAAEKIKTKFKIDTPWVVKPAKKELSKYAKP